MGHTKSTFWTHHVLFNKLGKNHSLHQLIHLAMDCKRPRRTYSHIVRGCLKARTRQKASINRLTLLQMTV